jgi:hypothetical protein
MGNRIRWRLFRTCLCKWKLFVGVLAERHKCFSSVDSQRIAMMQRALSWHKDVICHGGGPCSRRLPPSPPPPLCLIALSLPRLPISACRPSSTRATTPARTCTQSPFHTLFPAHLWPWSECATCLSVGVRRRWQRSQARKGSVIDKQTHSMPFTCV